MTNFTIDRSHELARTVFAGLTPSITNDVYDRAKKTALQRARANRSVMNTVPVLLVGSLAAAALNLTGPVEPVHAKTPDDPRLSGERAPTPTKTATITRSPESPVGPAPSTYTVAEGDTVSDIAIRYGLSTASVLALNGLSWSSLIFPGQELKLTKNPTESLPSVAHSKTTNGRYTIVAGDTVSGIATKFGVSTLSVLSANGLGWSSIIYPGQKIVIPGNLSSPHEEPDSGATSESEPDNEITDATSTESSIDTAEKNVLEDGDDQELVENAVSEQPPVSTPAPEPEVDSAPAPAPVDGSTYLVVSGDTVSAIAQRYGLSTQTLLDANGLTHASMIYIGDRLTIPSSSSAPASSGTSITYLSAEMRSNALVIVEVGHDLGVSDYGITIALATAMQESSLRNLKWGDRDSVGLFQQRPSAGWGTVSQLTTPAHAAKLFYGGPSNPNRGITRGLLDIAGWQNMSLTAAAQAVQISAYPDAYAKWEASAQAWLRELG